MKKVRITFTNGDIFDVDLQNIAEHRAEYYAGVDDFERGSKEWDDEIDYVMSDSYEGVDWLSNNMDWDEIQDLGEFVNTEDFDHAGEFFNAEFDVVDT